MRVRVCERVSIGVCVCMHEPHFVIIIIMASVPLSLFVSLSLCLSCCEKGMHYFPRRPLSMGSGKDDETLYCLTDLCFFSLHSSLFTRLSSLFSLCSLSASFFFPSLSLCSRQSHTSSTLCLFFGLQISCFFLVLHPHSSFSSSVLHPSPLLHLTISLDQKRTKPVHSLSHIHLTMQRSMHRHCPQGYSVPARTCRSTPRTESSYPRVRSVARRMLYSSGLILVLASCLQSIPTTSAQVDEPYDPDVSRLVGRFLHITDIHPDEHYITGGSISSSCHRNATDDDDDGMRVMRPGRTDGGIGGVYGSPYSICDSPFSLANATFDWIDKNLINNIDFVVWTGDNAR